MARALGMGPSEVVLAARVARLHFLDDRSKVDIAAELGISRFRVARLLESARSMGMVRIEIGMPGILDAALSAELAAAFGLRYAFVYDFPDDSDSSLRHRLGEAAGEALADIATPADVIGIAWSRSLSGLARGLTSFPPCPIVQMTGALSRPGGDDLLDVVRAVTRVGGGPSYGFYAPMIVADPQTAQAIRRHPDVAGAAAMAPSITIGMVGIGSWLPGLSSIYDALVRGGSGPGVSGRRAVGSVRDFPRFHRRCLPDFFGRPDGRDTWQHGVADADGARGRIWHGEEPCGVVRAERRGGEWVDHPCQPGSRGAGDATDRSPA